MSRDATALFRVVAAFWLVGWYCNAPGTPGFWSNFVDAQSHALDHRLFPAALQSAPLAFGCYLLPALALVAVVWPRRAVVRGAAALMGACALFACLHLETCNDATFVTSLWTAAWLNWLAHHGERNDRAFYAVGRGLAHAIVGLVFLGALVGKLTPDYHSGDAFYRLYFRDNPAWPYPALRASLSPEAFRGLATWFSRGSIWAETMLALAPILPTRFVLVLGGVTMLAMMSAWTFHLFSVVGSLFGLLIGAEMLRRREPQS